MQNAWLSEVQDSLNRGRFDMGDETKDKEAPAALRVKIKLGDAVIGPGKIMLLGLLEEEGGISAAARRLGLTYRRAWYLIDTVNQATGRAVVATSVGGPGGGGAKLTEFGRELVQRYRDNLARLDKESREFLDWLDQCSKN